MRVGRILGIVPKIIDSMVPLCGCEEEAFVESLRGESSARQLGVGDQIRWSSGMLVIRSRVYGVCMAPFLFRLQWILPQKFICPSVFIVLYFFFGPCVLYFHTFVSMLILGGKKKSK